MLWFWQAWAALVASWVVIVLGWEVDREREREMEREREREREREGERELSIQMFIVCCYFLFKQGSLSSCSCGGVFHI